MMERFKRKACKTLRKEIEVGGFLAQHGVWNVARKKMLEDRGALAKEESDLVREYKAMQVEHVLGCWLWQDKADKAEEV